MLTALKSKSNPDMIHTYLKGYLSKACTAEKDPSIPQTWTLYSRTESLILKVLWVPVSEMIYAHIPTAPPSIQVPLPTPGTLGRRRGGICPDPLRAVRQWTPNIPAHLASGLRHHSTHSLCKSRPPENLRNDFKRRWAKPTGTFIKKRWVQRGDTSAPRVWDVHSGHPVS